MLPPLPVDPSKPSRPSEPLLPCPLGVPMPPDPPRPPRPPFPPDPPRAPIGLHRQRTAPGIHQVQRLLNRRVHVLPSGSVSTTTSGDFSPGAISGPLGKLACIDVMGALSTCIFYPSLTCRRVHPPGTSSETIPRQATPAPAPRGLLGKKGRTEAWTMRLLRNLVVRDAVMNPTHNKAACCVLHPLVRKVL